MISEQIKTIRTKRKLTQDELAKLVGVQREAIARIESGIRTPSLSLLQKICEALSADFQIIERKRRKPY